MPGQRHRPRPDLLGRALDTAGGLTPLRSLILAQDGRIIAERRFSGPPADRPVNVKSVSKVVIAALTGIAITRGVFTSTGQTIAPLFADKLPADPHPRLYRITLDHLLSMRAGLEHTSGANYGAWVTSRDWVRHALSRPFAAEPGGPMLYSTGNSHLLSAALTRASGRSTLALARAWLGEPLGIAVPAWPRDPQGIYFGGKTCCCRRARCCAWRRCTGWAACWTADGYCQRHGCVPAGRPAPPRPSLAPRTATPGSWRSPGGHQRHFAWGFGGQMIHVVPGLGLSIVMTSDPAQRSGGAEGHARNLHGLVEGMLMSAPSNGPNP